MAGGRAKVPPSDQGRCEPADVARILGLAIEVVQAAVNDLLGAGGSA